MSDSLWSEEDFDEGSAELPYAGTSGNMKPPTSEANARNRDDSGETLNWQRLAKRRLRAAGEKGLTAAEFRKMIGGSYTTSPSTVFTTLLKAGKISRLTEERGNGRSKAYVHVLHRFVQGRQTYPYEPQKRHLYTEAGIANAEQLQMFLWNRGTNNLEDGGVVFPTSPQPGDLEVAAALQYLIAFSKPKEGKVKAK